VTSMRVLLFASQFWGIWGPRSIVSSLCLTKDMIRSGRVGTPKQSYLRLDCWCFLRRELSLQVTLDVHCNEIYQMTSDV